MPSKILVVDDMSLSRIILRARLSSACYDTLLAASGREALDLARRCQPDLVLMDCALPDLDGPDVCKILRADPMTAHIPVILFSADSSREMRLAALATGADDFLAKPLDESYLMSRLRALLRRSAVGQELRGHMTPALRAHVADAVAKAGPAGNVALVWAGPGKADAIDTQASGLFHTMLDLPTLLNNAPTDMQPDVLLLAPEIISLHGVHVISELRSRPQTRHIPIVVLLPTEQHDIRGMVLDLGAEDILCLPLDLPEARMRLDMVISRKIWADATRNALDAELHLASRDPLTGLFNRRHATSRLSELIEATDKGEIEGFALLLIDLDNFKRVNDTFGHLAGDDVLTEVGHRMRAALRPDDLLARYGGEEFLLALPNVGSKDAHRMAERIRHQIEGLDYRVKQGSAALRVTASIGVTLHDASQASETIPVARRIDSIIDQADQAMRMAKSSGRNRVSFGDCMGAPSLRAV